MAQPCVYAQKGKTAGESPRVFTSAPGALLAVKGEIAAGDPQYVRLVEPLKARADAWMDDEPWTITNKKLLPPSGDKHDYESQGPYWWPNPATPDGLPYVRRDGEVNPEIKELKDHDQWVEMTKAVYDLSLAWFMTGHQPYAEKATLVLQTWFMDEDTRMNPNLNFGQRIPGITNGRDIGIIETRHIGQIIDAVGMLSNSKAWKSSHQKGIDSWMRSYLDWLVNSEHGKGESRQHNNHGTWYDVQVAALGLFTGRADVAKEALTRSRDERLRGHIAPDGSQPHELARTRSWSYSVMNLQSFFTLATLGEHAGIDIWHHETEDGRSIVEALDYLLQFASEEGQKAWKHQQITPWDPSQLVPLLIQASCRFPDRGYQQVIEKVSKEGDDLHFLFYPCKPPLPIGQH